MVYGERFKVKSERELVKFFLSQISFHCTFLIKPHTHSPQWGQQGLPPNRSHVWLPLTLNISNNKQIFIYQATNYKYKWLTNAPWLHPKIPHEPAFYPAVHA